MLTHCKGHRDGHNHDRLAECWQNVPAACTSCKLNVGGDVYSSPSVLMETHREESSPSSEFLVAPGCIVGGTRVDAAVTSSIPTVGFNMKRVQRGHVTLKWSVIQMTVPSQKLRLTVDSWDLGGQPRFRSMWERYCRGVNAIVYGLALLDDRRAVADHG